MILTYFHIGRKIMYRVSKKKSFNDFQERLNDIFQNCLLILKLVVKPLHLKKKFKKVTGLAIFEKLLVRKRNWL